MNTKTHVLIRGIILTGFTLLVFKLLVTQNLLNYIAPKMMPFFYFTFLVLFVLSWVQFNRKDNTEEGEGVHCNCNHEESYSRSYRKAFITYSLFIVPLFIGFLFSDHTLGSAMAEKKGFKYELEKDTAPISNKVTLVEDSTQGLPSESDENNYDTSEDAEDFGIVTPKDLYPDYYKEMLGQDKIRVNADNHISTINLLEQEPDKFLDKTITLTGFIYREESFDKNRIVVGRFGVSCCVADAGIFGLLVEGEDLSVHPTDSWVQVTGTLSSVDFNGWELPMIKLSSIKSVQKPKQAYVYEEIDYSKLP